MEDLITDLTRRVRSKYYGKYRGFVVSNEDPDQLGRLQLQIPSVLGVEVTDWALPCVPFGGTAGLGWFVIPEKKAQVWVEFEEGELRRPIWTGTFWQKKGNTPKDAQKATPTTRLLQTAAGHILQFDDEAGKEQVRLHHAGGAELRIDENGTITITDQAKNVITLDASGKKIALADTHNNAVTMSSSGVKIEDGNQNAVELGASGVTISAKGQIVLDGKVVLLGGSGGEPVIKGQSFLDLFVAHVHTAAAPGSPTSPPMPPTPASAPTTLSTAVQTK
jgi:uncharacterized protein involved in type VI secretion and phage assembly